MIKTALRRTLMLGAAIGSGVLLVFALGGGLGSASASAPQITGMVPISAYAGEQVTLTGTGFGTQANGSVSLTDPNGSSWCATGCNGGAITIDSWSSTQVTFTVPTIGGTQNVGVGDVDTVAVVASGVTSNTESLTIVAPTYAEAVNAFLPTSFWPLNDTGGTTAADISGNSNTGNLAGGVSENVSGGSGAPGTPVMSFNGSTGYITTTTQYNNPTTYTIAGWFKTTATNGDMIIQFVEDQSGTGGNYDRELYVGTNGDLYFGECCGVTTLNSPSAVNNGAWHYAVGVSNGSNMYLYLDGVLVASNNFAEDQAFAGYWTIGGGGLGNGWPNAGNAWFNGSLADVSVFPSALTAGQVDALYTLVAPQLQTITLTSSPTLPVSAGQQYTPSATASSGLPVTFSIAAGSSSVCSISGGVVSFNANGTCVIYANQVGDASYAPAPQVQQVAYVGEDSFQDAISAQNPIAFWPLSDVGGTTAQDITGNGNTGTLVSGVTENTSGGSGAPSTPVMSFAGGTGISTSLASSTMVSVAAWFKTTSSGVLVGSTNNYFNLLVTGSGQVQFEMYYYGANYATSPGSYNDGNWHLAVATYDSAGMSLYVDGSLVATNSLNQWTSGGTVQVGESPSGAFTGEIADVAIFNQTLGASAIQQMYNPVDYYPPGNCSSVTLTATPSGTIGQAQQAALSATATCAAGVPTEYVFTQTPQGGTPVVLQSGFSSTYLWNNAGTLPIGNYTLSVTASPESSGPSASASVSETIVANAYITQALSLGPTNFWPLTDTGSNTANDISPQGYNDYGTLQGGVTQGTTPGNGAPSSPVMSFNGSTGNIYTNSPYLSPDVYTISGWFNTTAPYGYVVGFHWMQSATNETWPYDRMLYIGADGKLYFGEIGSLGSAVISTPGAVDNGQWHFAVGVSNGTSMALYLDGVLVGTNTNVANDNYYGWWLIGASEAGYPETWPSQSSCNPTCTEYFTGYLADIGVFPTALSAAQIAQLYEIAGNQIINFTSSAPTNASVSGATYTPTATSTSGLPVTLTIDGSSTGVCTISGGVVSFVGTGTCTIDANQAGGAGYNPADQVQQSFGVSMPPPTITSVSPISAAPGGTVTLTGTYFGSSVTSAGTYLQIQDNNQNYTWQSQEGNNCLPSSSITWSNTQITFEVPPYGNAWCSATPIPGSILDISVVTPSGVTAVAYVTVANPVISSVSPQHVAPGSIVTLSGANFGPSASTAGDYVQFADYALNGSGGAAGMFYWESQTQNNCLYAVTWSSTQISFEIPPSSPSSLTYCVPFYRTVVPGSTATVNVIVNGTFSNSVNLTMLTPQTVAFTSAAPEGAAVGASGYTPTASASSGLPTTITVDPSSATVCSISGGLVTYQAAGTCTLDANQLGNSTFGAAMPAQQSFTVGNFQLTGLSPLTAAPGQIVTLTGAGFGAQASGSVSLTDPNGNSWCASGCNGGPITIDTWAGNQITFTVPPAGGTVNVGVGDIDSVSVVTAQGTSNALTVTILDNQSVLFTSTAPSLATVGGSTYTPTAIASSGLAVTLSIDASSAAVCSISSGVVSFNSAGVCVIDANQGGNATYFAAPQVQQTVVVVSPYQAYVESLNPSAFWPLFDTGGTTAQDISGNGNNGTLVGGVTEGVAGGTGAPTTPVMSFDGSTGWITTPYVQPPTTAFTISAWFKTTTTGTSEVIVSSRDNNTGNDPFALTMGGTWNDRAAGQVGFVLDGSSYVDGIQSTGTYNDGNWHLATGVWSAPPGTPFATSQMTLYIDGIPVSTTDLGGNGQFTSPNPGGGAFDIGSNLSGWSDYAGSLADVAVFPTALTTLQVEALASVAGFEGATNCTAAALSASPTSPQGQGTPVTLTASSTCSAGVHAQYQFTETPSSGSPVVLYTGANSTYTWQSAAVPVGTYTLQVTATPVTGGGAATASLSYTTSTPASTYVAGVEALSPSAFWPLSDTGGTTAQDFSGNGNTGTLVGGVTEGVAGGAGSPSTPVMSFDGSTGLITTATSYNDPNTFSLVAWFNTTTTGGGNIIGFNASQNGLNGTHDRLVYIDTNGYLNFGEYNGGGYTITSSTKVNNGQWHFVVATAGPSGMYLYLDGVEIGYNSNTLGQNYTGWWAIGGGTTWNGSTYLQANIADVAIFPTDLTSEDVSALYQGLMPQTISFTSTPPNDAPVGGATYTPTATATSGLPVTFSIDASSASVCSMSGGRVSFTANGLCTIDANQSGNAYYAAASQVQQTIDVSGSNFIDQAMAYEPLAFWPLYDVGGTTARDLSGNGYTGYLQGGVTEDVAGGAGAPGVPVMNVNGGNGISTGAPLDYQVVTIFGWFKTTTSGVIADTTGNNLNLMLDPSGQVQFEVYNNGRIYVTSPQSYDDGNWHFAAGVIDGNGMFLYIDGRLVATGSNTGWMASGLAQLGYSGAGAVTGNSSLYGDLSDVGLYNKALTSAQILTLYGSAGVPQIAFATSPPSNPQVGGIYIPSAWSTSGQPVTLTIDSSASGVCSISSGVVSFTSPGTCTIDANQAAGGGYNAAAQAQQSFLIGVQTINFNTTPPASPEVLGTYPVSASATSGLPVFLSIDSSSASVCSLSGGVVTFDTAGTCTIDANQSGGSGYLPATQAQQVMIVSKIPQSINFTTQAPSASTVGNTYSPVAASSSGLPVTLTIDASSTTVCSLSGGIVTFNANGTCIIDANQGGNLDYAAAAQQQQSIAVGGVGIYSVTPLMAGAGSTVTVTGDGFGSITAPGASLNLRQNGGSSWCSVGCPAPVTIQSWSNTQIVFTVPDSGGQSLQAGGSYMVNVSAGGLTSNTVSIAIVAPDITSITGPSGGLPTAKIGDQVTVNGMYFGTDAGGSTSYLSLSGYSGSIQIVSWSDTQIVFVMPFTSGNPLVVHVNTLAGTSNGFEFGVSLPVITSVSPISASVGDTVTITGSNFGSDPLTNGLNSSLNFCDSTGGWVGQPVPFMTNLSAPNDGCSTVNTSSAIMSYISWTPTQITFAVPFYAVETSVKISVDTAAGLSNIVPFTITGPVITGTSVQPSVSCVGTIACIGSRVTISGHGFGNMGITLSNSLSTSTYINYLPVYPIPVSLTPNNQIILTNGSNTQTFNVTTDVSVGATSIPIISALPNFAYPALTVGQSTGIITPDNSYVSINGYGGPLAVMYWSQNAIEVIVPGDSSNNLYVHVPSGVSNGYFLPIAAPVITSVTPTYGFAGQTTVVVTGYNFGPPPNASGDGAYISLTDTGGCGSDCSPLTYVSWNDTTITFVIPLDASTGAGHGGNSTWQGGDGAMATVSVTTPSGTSNSYGVGITGPVITSIYPLSQTSGGYVTINGYDFGTEMTPTNPSLGMVELQQNGGGWQNSGVAYCSDAFVLNGGLGGTQGGVPDWSCNYFDTIEMLHVVSWSSTKIVIQIPEDAGTGQESIFVDNNNAMSNKVGIGINEPLSTSFPQDIYISTVSPSTQVSRGIMTITGNNFGATQGSNYLMICAVSISGVCWGSPADSGFCYSYGADSKPPCGLLDIVSWSNTSISFVVPPGLADGTSVSLQVVNPTVHTANEDFFLDPSNRLISNTLFFTVDPPSMPGDVCIYTSTTQGPNTIPSCPPGGAIGPVVTYIPDYVTTASTLPPSYCQFNGGVCTSNAGPPKGNSIGDWSWLGGSQSPYESYTAGTNTAYNPESTTLFTLPGTACVDNWYAYIMGSFGGGTVGRWLPIGQSPANLGGSNAFGPTWSLAQLGGSIAGHITVWVGFTNPDVSWWSGRSIPSGCSVLGSEPPTPSGSPIWADQFPAGAAVMDLYADSTPPPLPAPGVDLTQTNASQVAFTLPQEFDLGNATGNPDNYISGLQFPGPLSGSTAYTQYPLLAGDPIPNDPGASAPGVPPGDWVVFCASARDMLNNTTKNAANGQAYGCVSYQVPAVINGPPAPPPPVDVNTGPYPLNPSDPVALTGLPQSFWIVPPHSTTLTAAATGTATTLAVQALTAAVNSGDSLTISNGETCQTFTVSASAAVGATSINGTFDNPNKGTCTGTTASTYQIGSSVIDTTPIVSNGSSWTPILDATTGMWGGSMTDHTTCDSNGCPAAAPSAANTYTFVYSPVSTTWKFTDGAAYPSSSPYTTTFPQPNQTVPSVGNDFNTAVGQEPTPANGFQSPVQYTFQQATETITENTLTNPNTVTINPNAEPYTASVAWGVSWTFTGTGTGQYGTSGTSANVVSVSGDTPTVAVQEAQSALGSCADRLQVAPAPPQVVGVNVAIQGVNGSACGVPSNASITLAVSTPPASLSTALSSGAHFTQLSVSALLAPISAGDTLVLSNGTNTQMLTAAGSVAAGGTTIDVAAAISNAGYPVDSTIQDLNSLTVLATGVGVSTATWNTSGLPASTYTIEELYSSNPYVLIGSTSYKLLALGGVAQSITFTSNAPNDATAGGNTYTVSATASSGLTVTFSSATPSVCTVSGQTVSFVASGTCTINANQGGNTTYAPATQVQQSFSVAAPLQPQTITFTSAAPSNAAVGGTTYTPTATSTSGLPVTLTIDATSANVCTISSGVVTFVGAGTCTIDANQAGNASYAAASQVQQSFQVAATPNLYLNALTGLNPTAFWPLYDTKPPTNGTTAIDLSGHGYTGTLGSGVTEGALPGIPGQPSTPVMTFNGGGGISTPLVQPGVTAATYGAWINTTSNAVPIISGRDTTFAFDGNLTLDVGMYGQGSGLAEFGWDSGWGRIMRQSSVPVDTGKWVFVVATFNSSSGSSISPSDFSIYVNGVPSTGGAAVDTGGQTSPLSGSGNVYLGAEPYDQAYFQGRMADAFVIYGAALTPTQIQLLYDQGAYSGGSCTAATLSAAPASPQPEGGTVVLNSTASCTGGSPVEFQFTETPSGGLPVVLGSQLSSTGAASISFSTASLTPGTYTFTVVAAPVSSSNEATTSISDTIAPSSDNALLALGPSAFWPLSDTGGTTAQDASGNGYTGTLVGGVTEGVSPGLPLSTSTPVMSFNGSSGYIDTAAPVTTSTSTWTLMGWVNESAMPTSKANFIVYNGDGANGYGLAIGNVNDGGGSDPVVFMGGVVWVTSNTSIPTTGWSFVAVTYSNGNIQFYINGQPTTASVSWTNGNRVPNIPTTTTDIGFGNGDYMNGNLGDVAVFPTALTSSDISALYQGLEPQNITITSVAPSTPGIGGTYTPTATASSGLAVTESVDGSSGSVCSMSSGVVTFNSNGLCVVDYTQVGNSTYVFTEVQQSILIGGASSLAPSAFWPLSDTGGTTAQDISGNGNNGNLVGGVTEGVAGGTGAPSTPVMSFDGSTGYITTTTQYNNPTTYSIAAWFNTTATNGDMIIQFGSNQSGNSSQYDRELYVGTNGDLYFGECCGVTTLNSPSAVNNGVWHYAVGVSNGSSMQLYLDGILVASNNFAESANYTGYWRIGGGGLGGGWPNTGNAWFNGELADVAVFTTALTPGEVADLAHEIGYQVQTLTFSTAPNQPVAGGTYTPSVTSTSGLPVTITIDPSTASDCSITGGVVTFLDSGACTIDANQAGNSTYLPAGQAQQSFLINGAFALQPAAFWPLTDTGGTTALDASGNGNMGYLNGGVVEGVSSGASNPPGPAMSFNGSTSFISTTTPYNDPNIFSLAGWFKTTATANGMIIGFDGVQNGSGSGDRQLYVNSSGQLVFYEMPGGLTGSSINSTVAVNNGQWHFAVAVASPSGMQLYLDGALVASNTTASGAPYVGWWVIGADNGSFFNGDLADVAVYSYAMTSSDVALLYESQQVPTGASCSSAALSASPATSQVQGGATTVTASAACTSGIPLYYQFTETPSSGSPVVLQSGTSDTLELNDTVLSPGNYTVGVTVTPVSGGTSASTSLAYSIAPNAHFAEVNSFSPTAFWPLSDTGSGGAQDLSGNSNNGTLVGGVVQGNTNSTPLDQSVPVMNFNGNNGYITTTTQYNNPTTYSIAAWFNTTATNGDMIIQFTQDQSGTGGGYDRELYVGTNGELYFGQCCGVTTLNSSMTVNNGTWHYAVGVSNGSSMQLYLDGILVASNGFAENQNMTGYWRIGGGGLGGGWPNTGNAWFNGELADVAVFPTALTAAQVVALFNSTYSQTITFTSSPPLDPVGGVTYTPTAVASSGLPVMMSIDSSSSSVCSIASGVVTFLTAGVCTIDANQPGNATFGPATQVQMSIDVGGIYPLSPSAFWPLSDTGGTTASDVSGNGYVGTLVGGVTEGVTPGIPSNSTTPVMSFNGSNGYIATSLVQPAVSSATYGAWINTTSCNASLISGRDNGGTVDGNLTLDIGMFSSNSCHIEFGMDTANNAFMVQSAVPVNTGQWVFVTGVFQSTPGSGISDANFTIYINGQISNGGGVISAGGATSPLSGTGGIELGDRGGGSYYAGDMADAFIVFGTALNAMQVNGLYNMSNLVPPGNCSAVSLSASPNGATEQMNAVTLTASATCAAGVPTDYQFTETPSSGSPTVLYSGLKASYSFNAAGLPVGSYTLGVTATPSSGGPSATTSIPYSVTTNPTATTYQLGVAALNPAAFWPLSDTSGTTAQDISGNGNIGTLGSGVADGATPGIPGYSTIPAMSFNGNGGITTTNPTPSGVSNLTYAAWVNTTDTTGGGIFSLMSPATGSPNNWDWQLYMDNSGQFVFGSWNNGGFPYVVSPSSYNNGSWHFVVGTYSSTTGFALYVDGALVASNSTLSSTVGVESGYYFRIGDAQYPGWPGTTTSPFFNGDISNVAVFYSVLTPSQISTLYTEGN